MIFRICSGGRARRGCMQVLIPQDVEGRVPGRRVFSAAESGRVAWSRRPGGRPDAERKTDSDDEIANAPAEIAISSILFAKGKAQFAECPAPIAGGDDLFAPSGRAIATSRIAIAVAMGAAPAPPAQSGRNAGAREAEAVIRGRRAAERVSAALYQPRPEAPRPGTTGATR